MRRRVVADLSELPLHGFGSASLTWWGTLGFMLLEGTGFALAVATYLYLMSLAPEWPLGTPPPDLAPGLVMSGFLLVSLIWAVLPACGALPLLLALPGISVTDAYFEAMSGFSARYEAIACWSACAMLKVLNWCTLRSSRVSSGGATA